MSDLIKRDDAPEPCPFCRGKATIYWGSDEWTDADCYQVICDSCDVKGKEYKSREEAIAAWNTRALPAVTVPIHRYAGESEASVYDRKGFPPIEIANDPAAIREAALQARIEELVKEKDVYVEQLMVDANTFSEMHLENEQLRNKISEMQARINRLTLGGDRR